MGNKEKEREREKDRKIEHWKSEIDSERDKKWEKRGRFNVNQLMRKDELGWEREE